MPGPIFGSLKDMYMDPVRERFGGGEGTGSWLEKIMAIDRPDSARPMQQDPNAPYKEYLMRQQQRQGQSPYNRRGGM